MPPTSACAPCPGRETGSPIPVSIPQRVLIAQFKRCNYNEFDINSRGLLACAFAVNACAPLWHTNRTCARPLHVRFLIDNILRSHGNPAWHIPGDENTAEDVGPWQWQSASHATRFAAVIAGWTHAIPRPASPSWNWTGATSARALRCRVIIQDLLTGVHHLETLVLSTRHPMVTEPPDGRKVRVISEFIIYGAQHGFASRGPAQSSTIKSTLCGTRYFFTATGRDFPVGHPQIRILLKGVKRFDLPRERKTPVSVALLEMCAMDLNLHDPTDQALWVVLRLAFFFLLRRSEIVATTSTWSCWFALNAAAIAVIDALGCPTANPGAASAVCIRLPGSNTNQTGASVTRMLGRSGNPLLCPLLRALLLLKSRGLLPMTIPAAVYTDSTDAPQIVSAE
ncbi:hypothetical protein PHMEG_0005716 [Phytophthora megakarya]|uniref:Uncharacterized protein n=1 Tax=Phytophthora megakarya TaxID=4795 RepID=A0A225WQR7_9STRA|nr:hypothetical protein PHMEG_0005716 [Phytophthora megakarya]